MSTHNISLNRSLKEVGQPHTMLMGFPRIYRPDPPYLTAVITGTTKLLGVIGDPVEHSLSPVMHNAAIAHLGSNHVYLPFPIHADALKAALGGFKAIGLQGFNITIPHKQTILPFLSEVSDVAQAIGAVNTVWQTDSGWHGTNTDVAGFLAPLKELTDDRNWEQAHVVILGNGGAARAVVAGCAQLGCAKIQVVGRNPSKLRTFAESWHDSPLKPNLSIHTWDVLPNLLPTTALLVNSTPVGMHPQVEQTPLPPELMAKLPDGAIAYDLIYTPNPTQFLRLAMDRGLSAIDGSEMLVQQGAAALEIWLQRPAPVDVMRYALHQALGWT